MSRWILAIVLLCVLAGVAIAQSAPDVPVDPRVRPAFPTAPPPPIPDTPPVNNPAVTGDVQAVEIPLIQGWNLISLPFIAVSRVEGFNRAWLQIAASQYVPIDPVHDPASIAAGRAYLAWADQPATARVVGVLNQGQPFETRLYAGWNLLCCPSGTPVALDSLTVSRVGNTRRFEDALGAAATSWIFSNCRQFDGQAVQEIPMSGASLAPGKVVGIFAWGDCELHWNVRSVGAAPRIQQITPDPVVPGQRAVIEGSGFGIPGAGIITVNGFPAQPENVVSWSDTRIEVNVPPGAPPGKTRKVAILVNRVPSNALDVRIAAAPKISGRALGALTGMVTDASGRPLAGTQVMLDDGQSAVTSADGKFRIDNLPADRYVAYVSRAGYKTGTGQIQVGPGETRSLRVSLSPEPVPGTTTPTRAAEPRSPEQSTTLTVAGYPWNSGGKRYYVKKIVAWEYGNSGREWRDSWWSDTGNSSVELKCSPVYVGRSYRVIITWVDAEGNEKNGGWNPEIWKRDQRESYYNP